MPWVHQFLRRIVSSAINLNQFSFTRAAARELGFISWARKALIRQHELPALRGKNSYRCGIDAVQRFVLHIVFRKKEYSIFPGPQTREGGIVQKHIRRAGKKRAEPEVAISPVQDMHLLPDVIVQGRTSLVLSIDDDGVAGLQFVANLHGHRLRSEFRRE